MCAFYFFWLSASHDLRLGMDGMLLAALCDHGFERSGYCVVHIVLTIHIYIQSLIPPREDQCEWHRMTRMTGPDCVVMCNLINTYIHVVVVTHE